MKKRLPGYRKLGGVFAILATVLLVACIVVGIGVFRAATHQNKAVDPFTPSAAEVSELAVANKSGDSLYPCIGNPKDVCKQTPSIDFWPNGDEGAANTNFRATGVDRQIMGRIVSDRSDVLTLKTSSGRLFDIDYPVDTLVNFNITVGPGYPITVQLGDAILVNYNQPEGNRSTSIPAGEIMKSSLVINSVSKQSTEIEKY